MSQLRSLQAEISAFLISQPGAIAPEVLQRQISSSNPDAALRLSIYKNNSYASLLGALETTFPVVRRLVGEAFFRAVGQLYISEHPSTLRTLLGYGEMFPAFLKQFPPAQSLPYLGDVARLEIAYLAAYHAEEAEPALFENDFDSLRCAPNEHIQLHPSVQLFELNYAILAIWLMNRRATSVQETRLAEGPEYILVVRPHAAVEVNRMSVDAYQWLSSLRPRCSSDVAETNQVTETVCPLTDAAFDEIARMARSGVFVVAPVEGKK